MLSPNLSQCSEFCLLASTISFFLALRTCITSDMSWQSVPRDDLWLILNNQCTLSPKKLVSKLLCDPGPQGNTKRTFSSFLLLEIWVCELTIAILHIFIRGGVADTLGLANWKDEEEPGPWWHCWVQCWGLWSFPQQPCLGIKYMLRKGWAEKRGVWWLTLHLTQMSLAEVWRECWRGSKQGVKALGKSAANVQWEGVLTWPREEVRQWSLVGVGVSRKGEQIWASTQIPRVRGQSAS